MDHLTYQQALDFLTKDIERIQPILGKEVTTPLAEAKPIVYHFQVPSNRIEFRDAYLEAVRYLAILCRNNRLLPKKITIRSDPQACFDLHFTYLIEP